jgi:large subunit ribosomal protein L18
MATKRKNIARIRRRQRVRKKVLGTDARPRVCVYKSSRHIYAQVISDAKGMTLASASTLSAGLPDEIKSMKGVEAAKRVGLNLANVVFDRNGFLFHGRVKAVADGAREGGLEF